MRVITGAARGRKLKTLEGEAVRPTTARVKEAMFSVIQFDLEGSRVLDLFAGSGQLGIEALSRGAKSCTFVDSGTAAIAVVRENLERTGLAQRATVLGMDAQSFLFGRKPEQFDIVFLDPPYGAGLLQEILPQLSQMVAPGGLVFCENPSMEPLPSVAGTLQEKKRYRYGKTALHLFQQQAERGPSD